MASTISNIQRFFGKKSPDELVNGFIITDSTYKIPRERSRERSAHMDSDSNEYVHMYIII